MKKNMKRQFTRSTISRSALSTMIVGLFLAMGVSTIHASGYTLGDAANYVAIFQGGGGNTLNINNPSGLFANTDTGNIGLAGTGHLSLSGPLVINGNIDFAGSVIDNPPYTGPAPGNGITVNGSIVGGQGNVQADMSNLNSLSTTLGAETGTSVALNSGTTINANTTGTLDGMGDKVFTVTSISAANGTLTINGDGSHNVVINISAAADANLHFNKIVLTGGLTSDQVLFNLYDLNPLDNANLSGGPTLDLNSNGGTLDGIFLDPDGQISLVSTILDGRIFGGDSHDEQLVSGGTLVMPESVPDGGFTLMLLGLAFAGLVCVGHKFQVHPSPPSA